MICFAGVDPGVEKSAVADYIPGVGLNGLHWVRHDDLRVGSRLTIPDLRMIIVERPQSDGRTMGAATIALPWSGAAAAYSFGVPVLEWEPREWKGQEPKPIHHSRVWAVLTEAERALFPTGTAEQIAKACAKVAAWPRGKKKPSSWYPKTFESHNHLCATGLVLVHAGRLKKGT